MSDDELNLKPFELSDKELIQQYLSITNYISSEYSFVTWFGWQHLYSHRFAVIENCLCVFGKMPDGTGFVNFPVGEKHDVERAIKRLIVYFGAKNKPLVLMAVSGKKLKVLEELGLADKFKIVTDRDREDYIYLRENFTEMAGKKLHGKRNHYNYFADTYDARLIPITDDLVPECKKMLASVIEDRSAAPNEEYSVTNILLKNRDALGLRGNILLVNGVPIGIILGEGRKNNCIIHIAKADVSYRGAPVALFKLFLEQNFTDCEYVDLMDDLGIEGLRRAKMAWRPVFMADYHVLTYNG